MLGRGSALQVMTALPILGPAARPPVTLASLATALARRLALGFHVVGSPLVLAIPIGHAA